MTAFSHERLRPESVEFGEPLSDIGEHWLDENAAPGSTDPNAVALKPELAG